jgi:hypothetical protein
MTTIEKQEEEKERIMKGFKKVSKRLMEYKKARNSELVIMRDNKIVKIKPE